MLSVVVVLVCLCVVLIVSLDIDESIMLYSELLMRDGRDNGCNGLFGGCLLLV